MADTLTERQRQAREQEKSQRLARTRKVIRPPEPASGGTEPSKGSPVELIRTAYEIVVGDATPPKSSDSDFEFETLGERLAAIEDSTKVRAFIAERWRQYSDAEVEAFVDQGERIIVLLRFYLWLPESEREVSRPEAHVWTVRQGRVLDAFVHPALEVALRDAASANHF